MPAMTSGGGGGMNRLPAPGVAPIKPMFGADKLGGGLIVPRGEATSTTASPPGATPIGRFALVLLLFALTVSFLPRGARGAFVLIVILGALAYNEGAMQELSSWALGGAR